MEGSSKKVKRTPGHGQQCGDCVNWEGVHGGGRGCKGDKW